MTEVARKGVLVTDPETGEQFNYLPGDEVPEEHVDLIDEKQRPKVFEDPDDEWMTEDGESIVSAPNGNLAFDEDGEGEGGEEDLEDKTVPELRKYAAVNQIDLGGANRKDDILARIQEVEEERASDDEAEE